MKPAIPITDRRFEYVDSANTNIRKTFARVREEMAKTQEPSKVRSLRKAAEAKETTVRG